MVYSLRYFLSVVYNFSIPFSLLERVDVFPRRSSKLVDYFFGTQ
jgi:hypothetical protein